MTVTEDFAEEVATIHDPEYKEPFHIEQHGIDFIPESERWAAPRDVGGMWAGVSVQIEYFIYGAILMTFGFSFGQALSLIVVGNLSYFLLGLCSLLDVILQRPMKDVVASLPLTASTHMA